MDIAPELKYTPAVMEAISANTSPANVRASLVNEQPRRARILRAIKTISSQVAAHRYTQTAMKFLFNCSSYADIQPTAAMLRLHCVVAALISLFVGISIPFGLEADWSFREGYPMTMFSVFFLFVIGHFCLRIKDEGGAVIHSAAVWSLLGYTFIYLAFDDWLRIHETADHLFHRVFRIHETEFTDHLDDAIVAAYGLIVGAIILRRWRELMQFLPAIKYFIPAGIFAVCHCTLDFVVATKSWIRQYVPEAKALNDTIIWGEVIEEICKLYAEIFLVATVVCCYVLVRDRKASTKRTS